MKDRQLVFLIHDWFKLNPDMRPLYGLHEITDLKWFGDEQIFDFLELRRQIVENNSLQPLPSTWLSPWLIGCRRRRSLLRAWRIGGASRAVVIKISMSNS